MKNFITRTLSGAVYVALIIASILVSKYTFVAFFAVLLLIAMSETNRLIADKGQKPAVALLDLLVGLSIFFATFAVNNLDISVKTAAICPMLLTMVRLVTGLYLKEESAILSWAKSFFNICYVAVPMATLAYIYSILPILALIILALIWINDTGAFLVGCSIGKHRLFERISPKKSWEGFFGGFVFCIAAGAAANLYFTEESWLQWAVLGAVVSIAATLGDLIESLIKRTVGVKDSGNIMPGHGGILDRIDSLLLVAPATLVYLLFLNLL